MAAMTPFEAASLRVNGSLAKAVDKLAAVVEAIPTKDAPQPVPEAPEAKPLPRPLSDNVKMTVWLHREMRLLLRKEAAIQDCNVNHLISVALETYYGKRVTWARESDKKRGKR